MLCPCVSTLTFIRPTMLSSNPHLRTRGKIYWESSWWQNSWVSIVCLAPNAEKVAFSSSRLFNLVPRMAILRDMAEFGYTAWHSFLFCNKLCSFDLLRHICLFLGIIGWMTSNALPIRGHYARGQRILRWAEFGQECRVIWRLSY